MLSATQNLIKLACIHIFSPVTWLFTVEVTVNFMVVRGGKSFLVLVGHLLFACFCDHLLLFCITYINIVILYLIISTLLLAVI